MRFPFPGVLLMAGAAAATVGNAATLAPPGSLAAALAAAGPGDTVIAAAGVHRGVHRIGSSIVLRGVPGAVLDGEGKESPLTVTASGVLIEDVEIRGSGRDVMKTDAGVRVLNAQQVTLRRLQVHDVLYGIYCERATGLVVENCRLTGRVAPMDERGEGNGIHLWYCDNVRLAGNQVGRFLDAIYLSFVNGGVVEGNRLEWNGRYGLHTMYCEGNRLTGNRFALNVAGCALMFANHLVISDNEFVHNRGPRTYGLLLRDCSAGVFSGNRMVDNTIAVFLDNSNRNRFVGNLVQDNGWGLLLFSSSANNLFHRNNFIQNDYPVALDMRRTSNRFDDDTTGNYWSDNPAYDLDGDGRSDTPYSPVSAFAFVSKQYPDLTILAKSPAVVALGAAERIFPALRPSEAVDRHPMVRPVTMSFSDPVGIPARRPAKGAAAAFLGLGLCGLFALVRVRRA